MATISKALMKQYYRQNLVYDVVELDGVIYGKLDASLHGVYNDTIVEAS